MHTSPKTFITRVAAVTAGAIALTGVSMSVAIAAPAPATAKAALGAPVAHNLTQVTNLTPYTWTLFPSGMWNIPMGPYDIAPPATLAPGQTASWAAWHSHDSDDLDMTFYTFQDPSGTTQIVDVEDTGNGFDGDWVTSYSEEHVNNQIVESPEYHMAMDPDGLAGHVDAVWNTPTTIKIDAQADPAGAALAVNTQLPRAAANTTSFVYPQGEQPTVTHSDPVRATSQVINESSEPVTIFRGHDVARGQSTSLGEEVTASASTKVFGFAAKAAVSLTSEQEWGSTDSFSTDYDAEVDPGKMGWLNMDTTVSTLTGDLQFTTPDGITYQIENVAINQPGIASLANVPTGVNFTPDEGAIPTGN
jgi:hypothetical protein